MEKLFLAEKAGKPGVIYKIGKLQLELNPTKWILVGDEKIIAEVSLDYENDNLLIKKAEDLNVWPELMEMTDVELLEMAQKDFDLMVDPLTSRQDLLILCTKLKELELEAELDDDVEEEFDVVLEESCELNLDED